MRLDRMLALFGPLVVLCIAGGLVIGLLSVGYVSWTVFALSAAVGLCVGGPLSIWVTRLIKRKDPGWPPPRDRSTSDASGRS